MFNENKRQIEHIAPVGFAFLLRWIPVWLAVALCLLAMIYALFISRRVVTGTFRDDEEKKGYSFGKLMYAIMVLLLILTFHNQLYIAAGAWAILGMGDGFSTLAGKNFGATKLPWNSDKSWVGSMAFFIAGLIGSTILIWWVAGRAEYGTFHIKLSQAAIVGSIASLVCALVESLPLKKLDDNISVPIVSGGVIYLLFATHLVG